MRTSELIEKNNELRQLLNPENEQFYSDFLVYMRLASLLRSEFKIETMLLEILNDILDAQDEGINAPQYFGKKPKQVADELLATTPISTREILKVAGIIVTVLLFVTFLPLLVSPTATFDLGQLLILVSYVLIVILGTFKYIANTIYQTNVKAPKLGRWLWPGVVLLVVMVPAVAIMWVHTPWQFAMAGVTGASVIVVLMTVMTLWFLSIRVKKPVVLIYVISMLCGIAGLVLRIPAVEQLYLANQNRHVPGGGLLVGVLLILIIGNLVRLWWHRKNK